MTAKKLCFCFGIILINSFFSNSALASDPVGVYGKITWVEEFGGNFKISGKFIQAMGHHYSPVQEGYFYYFCNEELAICESILKDFKNAVWPPGCIAWGARRSFNGVLREHHWLPLLWPDAFPMGLGVSHMDASFCQSIGL